MIAEDIRSYYAQGRELDRLSTGVGRLEFIRTWDVLMRTLPRAPARILDIGGGTGVYAAPLAEKGYQVHVIDPVPGHVAAAAACSGVTASCGDARAIDEPDGEANAVLLLGPLYHLTDRKDRLRVWREAGRVARPGAPIVAATISRFANLFVAFSSGYATDPAFQAILTRSLADGQHRNPELAERTWFTTAYYHHPDEIPAEVADAGLILDRTVAVETALGLAADAVNQVLDDPAATESLLARLRQVEAEPSLHGHGHLLTVAHR
jgi:SAM-dependent methyltransferase